MRKAEFLAAVAAAVVAIWLVETKTPLVHASSDARTIAALLIGAAAAVIDLTRHRKRKGTSR